MPVTESKVERVQDLGAARIPTQRLPYAKEALPVRTLPPRRQWSAARWVIPVLAGTALVATGNWLLVVPLMSSTSGAEATQAANCVPQRDLFDVQAGMTRQAVVNAFSSAGRIEQYTPRLSLDVVYRSCAATEPWTRLLWIGYVWEQGEWRVAELHKGLGIVDPT